VNIQPVLDGATNFAKGFIPFLGTSLAVIAGIYLIYSAILALSLKGGSGRGGGGAQEVGWGSIAIRLLVGGALLRFGITMQDIVMMFTGGPIQDYRGVLAYAPLPAQAGIWKQVLEVCLLWIVMLGWAGAFRGLLLWSKATYGSGGGGSAGDLFWQGTWHLIGGALAVNMTGAIEAFLS
jgi:hypothetical protein